MKFQPGNNIAIKVPDFEFEATIGFYRDILMFKEKTSLRTDFSVAFEYGDKTLWVDRCPQLSRSEVWLDVKVEDLETARKYFEKKGVEFCDDVEKLPEGFKGFWICSPSNTVHLIEER